MRRFGVMCCTFVLTHVYERRVCACSCASVRCIIVMVAAEKAALVEAQPAVQELLLDLRTRAGDDHDRCAALGEAFRVVRTLDATDTVITVPFAGSGSASAAAGSAGVGAGAGVGTGGAGVGAGAVASATLDHSPQATEEVLGGNNNEEDADGEGDGASAYGNNNNNEDEAEIAAE